MVKESAFSRRFLETVLDKHARNRTTPNKVRFGGATSFRSATNQTKDWRQEFVNRLDAASNQGATELTLDFQNSQMGDAGVQALSDVLMAAHAASTLPSLVGLLLENSNVGAEGAKTLSRLVCGGALSSLKSLGLGRNKISHSPEGMGALATSFGGPMGCKPPPLRRLEVRGNWIGDAGMEAFAACVAPDAFPNLEYLGFADNKIGDKGIKKLADAIVPPSNPNQVSWELAMEEPKFRVPSLHKLDLLPNRLSESTENLPSLQIGEDGMHSVSNALRQGALSSIPLPLRSLSDLDLSRNQIGDEGMRSLSNALREGALPSLDKIYLSFNSQTQQGDDAVTTAMARREGWLVPIQEGSTFFQDSQRS